MKNGDKFDPNYFVYKALQSAMDLQVEYINMWLWDDTNKDRDYYIVTKEKLPEYVKALNHFNCIIQDAYHENVDTNRHLWPQVNCDVSIR